VKKTKILYCIHDLRGRGAEKVLATLLRKFDRNRYVAGVFVYHDTFTFDIPEDVLLISAHMKPYPPTVGIFTKLKMNLFKIMSLGKALRNYKPDIAISISGTNISLILSKYIFLQKNTKVILSEHTIPSVFIKESNKSIARILTNLLVSLTYGFADLIITPSRGVQEDLSLHYKLPGDKIKVIPNPLDMEGIRKAAETDLHEIFPKDNSFKIGFIGSLSREKNVQCLIRAFNVLVKRGMSVRLFLVGEGYEGEHLKLLSRQLSVSEYVHFLGYRENPYNVLKNFDVLVLPSLFEVFPNVILEAMACGVPVISTKWSGSEATFRHMGNCLLVPIDDHGKLAEAIQDVMGQKDLREKLIKNGLDLARKCDADNIMNEYSMAIDGVLG
jgi:glycosyltransferase involved in cell wall biosynthesis